jgi:hypothetical protein
MKSRIGVTFKVVWRRGMGVRLGKLPMTRRHLEQVCSDRTKTEQMSSFSLSTCPKGAFTRVPHVDQHGWINQSEPCKQFLSTEWSTGLTGEQAGDGQLSFTVVDSLWVTHHRLPVSTSKSRPVPQCRTSFFPSYFFFLKCVDIVSLNSHISQQHLPAQVHLPPFWNRLSRSPLWNCVNSIVQRLNSISLIQPRWSTWRTHVNAPLAKCRSVCHCSAVTISSWPAACRLGYNEQWFYLHEQIIT